MKYLLLALLLAGCAEPRNVTGVVIGGSIAEGHPGLQGLHHGQAKNQPGQISYALQQHFHMRILNQGIGGQTCGEVWSRWDEDVLAYNPTLVWFGCGANDFDGGDPAFAVELAISQAVRSSEENGFDLYLMTLSYDDTHPERRNQVDQINSFIWSKQSSRVIVADFHEWREEKGTKYLADHLHPTKTGYMNFMAWFFSQR